MYMQGQRRKEDSMPKELQAVCCICSSMLRERLWPVGEETRKIGKDQTIKVSYIMLRSLDY